VYNFFFRIELDLPQTCGTNNNGIHGSNNTVQAQCSNLKGRKRPLKKKKMMICCHPSDLMYCSCQLRYYPGVSERSKFTLICVPSSINYFFRFEQCLRKGKIPSKEYNMWSSFVFGKSREKFPRIQLPNGTKHGTLDIKHWNSRRVFTPNPAESTERLPEIKISQ